ncbi:MULTISPECIES: M10 family metallopeptidase C-terminal domain-containing protein [Pseudomonas]|uniref:PrtC_2 protein n=2 Tax=Pseudomonas TaxID=286 RepID=A0A0D0T0T1_PSEFL|nr:MULTISPECIES: M10 family metallopeptidase C-terminal domain-containing protein [Pseudomonas fluorescens group]AZE61673.1 Alkaline phosphatase [Pseudomonas synxantha]KIR16029.1 Serralysin C precursor [Pseudomonas fluorescens]
MNGIPPSPTPLRLSAARVSQYEPEEETDAGKSVKMSLDTFQAGRIISRNGAVWGDQNRDGHTTIYYKFGQHNYTDQHDINTNFTESQKNGLRLAMQSWSDIANVAYKEKPPKGEWVDDGKSGKDTRDAEATLSLLKRVNSHDPGGYAGIGTSHVGITFRYAGESTLPNTEFAGVAIHELGHHLGLPHPGNYNGRGSDYEKDAAYNEDTIAHSIMSYFSEKNNGYDFKGSVVRTPMMDDISASQRIYGANYNTRNTDTTYGFNSNTGREALTFKSSRDRPVLCIWDGGGNDTLDCSKFAADQQINLNEQTFSNVAGLKGNISIARGVTLENAVGGHGNDQILGNDADNRLTGGVGADQLTGGKGKDTFIYKDISDSTPEKPDLITDFVSGTDSFDLSAMLKKNGLKDLHFVSQFSGRAGEALLDFDEDRNLGRLKVDLSGKGRENFMVTTNGRIYPSDVLSTPSLHKTVDTSPPRFTPDGARTDGYVPPPPPPPLVLPPTVKFMTGTQGNDVLRGDHGDNNITGGAGADVLFGGAGKDIFIYEKASDSSVKRPDQILDFTTGIDKIDVSKALQAAGTDTLIFVEKFTGRIGETVIRYNAKNKESSLAVDMTGNGKADLHIVSRGQIKADDIISK